jgi:hypothetical protein
MFQMRSFNFIGRLDLEYVLINAENLAAVYSSPDPSTAEPSECLPFNCYWITVIQKQSDINKPAGVEKTI